MQIEYYTKTDGKIPVKEYISKLESKFRAKVMWEIGLLEKFGLDLKLPYVKAIQGKKYNKIFELRVKFSTNISRIFYFSHTQNSFMLLHAYTKKSNKTDTKELEKALANMNDYNERFNENEK